MPSSRRALRRRKRLRADMESAPTDDGECGGQPGKCGGQPGKCGGQPGKRDPAAPQTPVGDDACIVPHTPRHRKHPGRDLRPKSRRCAAVGLRNAPAGAVNPAPTNKFCASGQTGTAATHPDDRRAGCPHPAAPHGGANVSILNRQCAAGVNARPTKPETCGGHPGNCGPTLQQTPVGDDACIVPHTPRRRKHPGRIWNPPLRMTANAAQRPGPPAAPLTTPPPLHKGAFFVAFLQKHRALFVASARRRGHPTKFYNLSAPRGVFTAGHSWYDRTIYPP